MATKTLGIKFQIAGVKEAQAGLNNLRNNLNSSLQQNKKAVNDAVKLNNIIPTRPVRQRGEAPYDYVDNYQRTAQAVRQKQYRKAADIYARPRFNAATGGIYEGLGNAAGQRIFDKLDSSIRKIFGLKEYNETVDLSSDSIRKVGVSVASALAGRNEKQTQRDINKGLAPKVPLIKRGRGVASGILDQMMMPIKTLQYSFYEGIGGNFGNQFAEGLSKVLSEDLDVSFNRKGQVTGKAVAYTATNGVERFKQDVSAVGDNFNDLRYAVEDGKIETVTDKVDNLVKSISKSITSIADSYLRGFRLGSVKLEALRKMEGEIAKQDNQAPDLTGKKKAIFTVSGFAGEKGQRGHYMADQLRPYVKDDTEVVGVENKFTDVLSPSDKNTVLWGISALSNLAKINLKGFNSDSVELAAKVINTIAANPDIEVDMLGHSAGGFVVEEAQEILNQLGYGDRVGSKIVGTPQMAGRLENANTDKIMGEGDFRIKSLEAFLEYLGAAQPTDSSVKGVKDHFFQDYLDSPDFLQEILGDSLDKDKAKTQTKKRSPFKGKLIELESLYANYVSKIYQDLEELGDELSVAPDRLVAKSRRNKLRDRGGKELDRKLRDKDFKPIDLKEETETAVLVAGGFSGAKGRSGAVFAKKLNNLVEDDKTQYVGVRNPFTDVLDKDDIRNPDPQKSIPKILNMFGEVHQKGYNPDAVEIAAQVIDLLNKDPNLKVKVGGYSGGGYVAEDVAELLDNHDIDMNRVEVMGLGTPQLPGGIKNPGFKKIMGKGDPIMMANKLKEINNKVKSILGFDIFPELMAKLQNVEGIESHDLDDYVANSKEVQNLFYGHIPDSRELIENYSQIQSFQTDLASLNKESFSLMDNKDLSKEEKALAASELVKKRAAILKQIHVLAKRSQSIGGGKFFADEREFAAVELEDAGIIVDPVKVEIPDDDPWQDVEQEEKEVITNRSKALAQEYKKYLESIKDKTTKDSKVSSQVIARDFASQNPQDQKEFLTTIINTFSARAKAYRKAVKDGQLELAREQGEGLINLAALIKNLYGELSQFEELDPEVQGTFKSYSGYITSVENEVLSGTKRKGGVEKGLPDIFKQQLEQDGENISEGFIEGVLGKIVDAREAGEKLVEGVDEGIRDRGEIKSPSRLAKRLGKWFAQGFGLGMAAENMEERGREVVDEAAEGLKQQVKQAFDPNNISSLMDTSGAGIIKKIGGLIFDASQNEQFDQVLGTIAQLIGKVVRLVVTFKLLKVALDAFGLGKFIDAFRDLPDRAIAAAMGVEALDARIIRMSGSARTGAKNIKFITDEAERLNRNLTNAKENYAQVLGATRDSSLEGFQTENIYSAFAATAKNNALSATEEQEIFRSVRSIIGKDILSQEEVRQEIGEKLGDFEKSLAEAYGVSRPQLNQMISNREIRATEALPKVAAVLRAKNDIAGELDTSAAAAQRADNAVVSFQESVGSALLPIQKIGNNFIADLFDRIANGINAFKPLVNGFFLALFINLLRLEIFGQTVQKMLLGIIKLLWTMKGALGVFLVEMVLIAAAWKAWEGVLGMLGDRFFPKINQEIEQLTRGMKAYRQAIDEANGAQSNLGRSKLQLAEGLKLPDNKIGNFVREKMGSDYLNLDSLIFDPWNNFLTNAGKSVEDGSTLKGRFTTYRQLKEEQLVIGNADLSLKGNQLYSQNTKAFDAAKEIRKYDAQIAEIQSARLKLLPGDQEALKASLEEEKKINKERDKQLRVLSSYQQTLNSAINIYKSRLEQVEQAFLSGEIDQATRDKEVGNLQGLLTDTEDIVKNLNDETSKLAKSLSVFQRRLRDSSERVEGFLAQSDRSLQLQRADIINQGIADGTGNQTIQIELEEAQAQDLQRRIEFVKAEISELESDLDSPELADGVRRVKQLLSEKNIPLNESSLQRIIEETPVQADREAAQGLLEKFKRNNQLSGLTEQLAQTIQGNRNALIDFNRTVEDYFFNINQQIKEAQIEVLRIINQIIQTQIRNKLQSALSPNADSFVNGLISSTQSLLDQAASYAERVLGQRGAKVQLAGQKRSLQYELNDFARNVRGAGDALVEFKEKIGDAASPTRNSSDTSNSSNTSGQWGFDKDVFDKSNSLPVPGLPRVGSNEQLPPPPPVPTVKKATKEKEFLEGKLGQKVELDDELLKLEGESLKLAIKQNIDTDRRKIDNQIVDTQFALSKLLNAGKDMASQYNYQTAPQASAKSIRDVNNAYSDRGLEISRQITKYLDEINSINKLVADSPKDIKFLRDAGRNDEANILLEKVSQSQLLLDPYNKMLLGLVEEYENVTEEAETALKFVTEQNKLKEHQERLNKRSLLLNQQATLAEARGTVEAGRKVKKHQEDLRLYLRINELRQQYAPGEYLDSLIRGEQRQSQVNQDNINYDSQIAKLDLEKRLLDTQTEIDNKKGGLLSRFGVNFGAEKTKQDNKIAQENLRFERELIELRKQYKDQPELLEELARRATELNSVNLFSIQNEFKTLSNTIEDAFGSAAQGFFSNIQNNLFDSTGSREKAELEERLRYAEQIVSLENQYREQPGQLAHMKNRARELNEQKLDKISEEFNLFKKGVDLARQALLEFIKQLGAAIAQAAAAKVIGAIIGGVAGGFGGGASGGASAVGNDYGSGAGTFTADEGWSVGDAVDNYRSGGGIKSRKLSDRFTNFLRKNAPGVAKAWNKEGRDAQLGVFHKNEELISDKTGEAPAYRGLKRMFGVNPAQQIIANFSDGGTVGTFDAEANILSGFKSDRSRFDLSVLDDAVRDRRSGQSIKNITLQTTVITPDADSFRLNEDQRNQDLLERLRRGI